MSTLALHKPNLSRSWIFGTGGYGGLQRPSSSCCTMKGKECLGEAKRLSLPQIQNTVIFNTPHQPEYAQFVAREARHHEEYWTASWLRAESHWENRENEQYAANNKRKFAQEEFNAMRGRYNGIIGGDKCKCIIMVQLEKPTISKSVVGTLDLSIRHFKHGETFPGERAKHPFVNFMGRKDSICYAYIANLCVAKSVRRQGVGRRMLEYAISTAKASGAEKAYVHVHRHNTPARNLYHRIGFQVVDAANLQLSLQQTYLLCLALKFSDTNK